MSKIYYDQDLHDDYCDYSSYNKKIKNCTSKASVCVDNPSRPQRLPFSCEPREAIKNGSFETPSPVTVEGFADWTISVPGRISPTNLAYEGIRAAQFVAGGTPGDKTSSLLQNVTLTPGCLYQFSFAENLTQRSGSPTLPPTLTARVFYTRNGVQFDLINVVIRKVDGEPDVNKGYTFHKKISEIAVPSDVTDATVEFRFTAFSNTSAIWGLDGVSLYAVASSSTSCG